MQFSISIPIDRYSYMRESVLARISSHLISLRRLDSIGLIPAHIFTRMLYITTHSNGSHRHASSCRCARVGRRSIRLINSLIQPSPSYISVRRACISPHYCLTQSMVSGKPASRISYLRDASTPLFACIRARGREGAAVYTSST